MSGINDKQRVNALNSNAAWLAKNGDDATVGKVSLQNNDVASGSHVTNLQKAINKIYEGLGTTGESDTAINDYDSNNYITDGDDRKQAIEKLDAQVKVNADNIALLSSSFGNVQTKTSAYTALNTDALILCSGAAFTVTLYTAVGNSGREITIKKTDTTTANKITIAFNGAETADGASTLVLYAQYDEYTLISNGQNWSIKSKIIKPVVFVGTVNSNFTISSTTPLTITESKDTHDAWSTNTFTVPYASDYILGFVAATVTGTDVIQIYKNGIGFYLGGNINTGFPSFYIYMKDLAAGDTIQIRSSSAITISGNGNAQYSIRSV